VSGPRQWGTTNRPGTCLYCGRKVPATKLKDGRTFQRYGEYFDALTCALGFAKVMANAGHRLVCRHQDPTPVAEK